MSKKIEKLAKIIFNNPGCVAVIDNDHWTLYATKELKDELADSDTHGDYESGYGTGPSYGGDILQALALIVGIEVKSV